MTPGFVSIVGAGPGAPDLLTVRARSRLECAHLVLYDGLVPPGVVRLAASATHRCVARRRGQAGPSPGDVAELMTAAARRGQFVVRLRAGDPFVLARGAEEALALADAGVPFEIVPGVTSATAAPLLAGIPLTHRGVASAFLVVSGHSPRACGALLQSTPPNSATMVVLMGVAARGRIGRLLLRAGWRTSTPAAIVLNASRARQRTWFGPLSRLGAAYLSTAACEPGVLVIGDVVDLATGLKRGSRQPRQEWSHG